ncbi:hypothetical protein N5E86_17050, partial [Stutzerimonas stutzeri]|uniref:hypothetical protein n=1 Tax=Stutzerimonas stutzeri TaxID=316 RepID=UPI002448060C
IYLRQMKKAAFFDNNGSRFAKAVDHFGLIARSRSTFVSLTCKRPKCSTAPYLKVSSMGRGGILEGTLRCFKYAPAILLSNHSRQALPGRNGDCAQT